MRFEVFFSTSSVVDDIDIDNSIQVAAVASGAYITSSSEWDPNHSVHGAGIDSIKSRSSSNSWCAASNNKSQWVSVDVVDPKLFTAIET